jgi:hypothetical protein
MRVKRYILTLLLAIFLIEGFSTSGSSAWLIFYKPAYKGKIIDEGTNTPIEEAIVVAVYSTESIIGGPRGSTYSRIHFQEALTDQKGEFYIPAYITLMGPNSKENEIKFIFYKPGYGRFPIGKPPDHFTIGPDIYFSKEIGTKVRFTEETRLKPLPMELLSCDL